MLFVFLLKGIVVGIVIAVPVGPVGVMCVRRTIFEGRLAGFVSGLGAATADALFGFVAAFGLTFVSDWLVGYQHWLRVAGGCYLLYVGGSALLRSPEAKANSEPDAESLLRDYLSTFALTLTNPITILAFLGIFSAVGLNGEAATLGRAAILVLGVWLGSLLWWLALTFGLSSLFRSFGPHHLVWINRGSGIILALSGAALLAAPIIEQIGRSLRASAPGDDFMVYLPPAFTEARLEVLTEHIERHDFGLLVSHGAHGLVASHIPFLIERDGKQLHLHGHLARPNPQIGDLASGSEVLAIFHGPHAYISPKWYQSGPAVPTWNYIDVHAYGTVRLVDDVGWLRQLLDRLSERHEAGNPSPWRMQDLPEPYLKGMLKGIIGLEIAVTRLEGKYKLSQNRPAADRSGVIAALEEQSGEDARDVARLMREREPV
jgi:predicted FMN-binding regulatory protein PaiB/threonine/homoserine/homoserine lactone efflux protein